MKIGFNKYTSLIKRLADIIHSAKATAVRQINKTQVLAYYEIGREIVEFEQRGKARAEYGEELIVELSKDMTLRFGKGFSERNLRNMRALYLSFPHLSWSHYCELLSVEHPLARSFYEKEAVNNNWSFRELKRQINSQLFERLALSRDSLAVMKLAKRGHIIETPEDAIKDPYVLEFLNLKEENVYTESKLEQAIIDNLQKFLLEMGKGFAFVARQKRITVGNRQKIPISNTFKESPAAYQDGDKESDLSEKPSAAKRGSGQ